MNCRRYGSKTTIALWMLVAVADLAILVAAAGVTTMILILAALVALAGGVVAARTVSRPHGHATGPGALAGGVVAARTAPRPSGHATKAVARRCG